MAVIIDIQANQAFGSQGSPFGSETAVLLTTTQTVTLSQGVWMVNVGGVANAPATVDYSPDAGTTWRTLARGQADATRSNGIIVFSDGYNVRINQASTASTTTTYYTQVKSLF